MAGVPVRAEPWVIGDHGDPPRVGRTEQYVLQFLESSDGGDPAEPGVFTWDLVAEPLHEGRWQQVVHVEGHVVRDYVEVLLHGDGWAASWCSPRAVGPGPVRVRGSLFWSWPTRGRPETRFRGLVSRVQVVTKVVDTSDADRDAWSVVAGGWQTRDVAESLRTFECGYALPYAGPGQVQQARYPNPWASEVGVLVTLDPARAARLMPAPRNTSRTQLRGSGDRFAARRRSALLVPVGSPDVEVGGRGPRSHRFATTAEDGEPEPRAAVFPVAVAARRPVAPARRRTLRPRRSAAEPMTGTSVPRWCEAWAGQVAKRACRVAWTSRSGSSGRT